MRKIFYALTTVSLLIGCKEKSPQFPLSGMLWIDLTYSFDSTTLYWPNNKTGFEHHQDAAGITPSGYYYSSFSYCTPEHGGTHLDAPIHFAEQKLTVDQIPLDQLTGGAIVIDVSKNALQNRDYLISIADIENWEKINGTIPDEAIVLFNTGYGKFYPNREKYFGSALTGAEAIPLLHFPGIDPKTTDWLIKKRKIKALGLDTPSIDYGQSKDFKTHQILMGANKSGFENLANLDLLPPTGIYVVALPMKIGAGSGAPLRIIAAIPSKTKN
jgi:kynurenine formamidase